ncbi:MAG: hypothetical protein KJ892_01240 [Gammaproteobacteria bacterium]|nr:hypothetical protein [Gammaproteobacteria bacterium]MBU2005403.1 hypothetical protein [Gammaproteobacteria bacterium]
MKKHISIFLSVMSSPMLAQAYNIVEPVTDTTIIAKDYYTYGSEKNELIIGKTDRTVIKSYGGNDVIKCGNASDYADAGDGNNVVYGNDGDDQVYSVNGNDILVGGNGNDVLLSYGGKDVYIGGSGNDTLYGKGGTADNEDTSIFTGKFSDYKLTQNNSVVYYIEDLRSGSPDGKDRIVYMDKLEFTDGTFYVLSKKFTPKPVEGNRLSSYGSPSTRSDADNAFVLLQAINDTPANGTLFLDTAGIYPVDREIKITKPIKIVASGSNFTLKLTGPTTNVLFIDSENVSLSGLAINGNRLASIGIYSNYANVSLTNNKIYNIAYTGTVSGVAWGIGIVPRASTSNNANILVKDNEIYALENTYYDSKRANGFVWGVHIAYHQLKDQTVNVEVSENNIHDLVGEEDDHIVIGDDRSVTGYYGIRTTVKNNRSSNFTRRCVKTWAQNVSIENNTCNAMTSGFDTNKYPPFAGIESFGANTTIKANTIMLPAEFESAIVARKQNLKIQDNTVRLAGGKREQYLLNVSYDALDYEVTGNNLTMVSPLSSSHFFYQKGNTRGLIKNNAFTVENTSVRSLSFQTVYQSSSDSILRNETTLENNSLTGSIQYMIDFSGKSSANFSPVTAAGKVVRTIFEGNKVSSTLQISGL